jgi:hypothetical protein
VEYRESDYPLYSSRSLYYEMISRASFGIVLSIGAVLFSIWPNILPLQQHLAMAQVVPGSAPMAPSNQMVPGNTTANTTAGAPAHAANTTAGAAEDTEAEGELSNH